MISIITPTVRPEGLKLVEKALKQQDYQEFTWTICSPFDPKIYGATWIEDKFEGGLWTLNRAYNAMLKGAQDLVVSWQDFTYAKPDTLSRFYIHYIQEPNTLVGAVGNKYQDSQFTIELWRDPRIRDDQGTYYECYPDDIEWNLCSVPFQALKDVGGFMEEFDFEGYGLDGYNVNKRIDELGKYKFKLDQTIKSYSLTHDRKQDWEDKNLLHDHRYDKLKERLIKEGKWPKAPYI